MRVVFGMDQEKFDKRIGLTEDRLNGTIQIRGGTLHRQEYGNRAVRARSTPADKTAVARKRKQTLQKKEKNAKRREPAKGQKNELPIGSHPPFLKPEWALCQRVTCNNF